MLPQVLAGLGIVSVMSTGCIVSLDQMRPLFVLLAATALTYQAILVLRRPPKARTRRVRRILWASLGVNAFVLIGWLSLPALLAARSASIVATESVEKRTVVHATVRGIT